MATRELTSHAAAAKAIRTELKAAFPTVKFSVRSDSYSNGDSVHAAWTDGPTTDQVDAIIQKYQYGHFDGMIDLYEYSNRRKDIPQVKFVFSNRGSSPEAFADVVGWLNRRYGWGLRVNDREPRSVDHTSDAPMDNGWGYRSHEIHRELQKRSLVCTACNGPTLPSDLFCPACGAALPDRSEH